MSLLLTENILVVPDINGIKAILQNAFDHLNERLAAQPTPGTDDYSSITISASYVQSEIQQLASDIETVSDKLDTIIDLLVAQGVLE